jgi:hypothetical protein
MVAIGGAVQESNPLTGWAAGGVTGGGTTIWAGQLGGRPRQFL